MAGACFGPDGDDQFKEGQRLLPVIGQILAVGGSAQGFGFDFLGQQRIQNLTQRIAQPQPLHRRTVAAGKAARQPRQLQPAQQRRHGGQQHIRARRQPIETAVIQIPHRHHARQQQAATGFGTGFGIG